jgi:transposase
MEVSLDSHDPEPGAMGTTCARTARQGWDPGATASDNRLFVEAVLWIARTGAPWRDLPGEFGKWYSIYTRFWRWAQKGVWERVFKALSDDPDFEYVLIDATYIRVHQHGTGAKGGLKIRPSASRAAA